MIELEKFWIFTIQGSSISLNFFERENKSFCPWYERLEWGKNNIYVKKSLNWWNGRLAFCQLLHKIFFLNCGEWRGGGKNYFNYVTKKNRRNTNLWCQNFQFLSNVGGGWKLWALIAPFQHWKYFREELPIHQVYSILVIWQLATLRTLKNFNCTNR